jgi:hypothetical protein
MQNFGDPWRGSVSAADLLIDGLVKKAGSLCSAHLVGVPGGAEGPMGVAGEAWLAGRAWSLMEANGLGELGGTGVPQGPGDVWGPWGSGGAGRVHAPEHELHLGGGSRSCGAWRGEEAGGNRGSTGVHNKTHRIVWNNIAYRMEFIKMTRREDPETSPKTTAQQIVLPCTTAPLEVNMLCVPVRPVTFFESLHLPLLLLPPP